DAVLLMKTLWLGSIYITSGAGPWRGVRTRQFTYARKSDTKKPWMLFDNEKDPYQYHNLVNDPAYSDLVNKLDEKTNELLVQAGDPEDPDFFIQRIQEERQKLGLPKRDDLNPTFVEPGSVFKKYFEKNP
ncbi:MAG TPA: sulfatase/phosphatase domain-containing protein, partial [Prolixibacteraceae bacterium]|nr:sulfatase/phosphatase domain-containing protein [Prolixibacteraceae bacterium]